MMRLKFKAAREEKALPTDNVFLYEFTKLRWKEIREETFYRTLIFCFERIDIVLVLLIK